MTEHIDIEVLADYAEGLLDSAESARVSRHLAECAACTEQYAALGDVSAYLSALPPPAMPADVATRIEAAIAEESRARSAQSAPAGAGPDDVATVVPLRSRSRRWIAPLTAAAAAVVVVGGGFAIVKQTTSSDSGAPTDTNAQSAPSQELRKPAVPDMVDSGTHYTDAALGSQVNSVVKDSQSGTGAMRPKSGRETPPPSLPASISGCVERISGKVGSSPMLVDHGTYDGREVKVLVFKKSGSPARYDVWIVGSGCSADADGVVTHTTVPRHS